MWRTMRVLAVFGLLAALGAAEAETQDQARRERALRRGPGVEAIMRMRDRLELTDEQITGLEEIRREAVEQRATEMAQIAELRSQLEAGQIERSELMAFREERRETNRGLADARRTRIESVLDEAQLEAIQEMRGRARAFARGRMSARRGPGGAWNRGRPGLRGPGDGMRRRGPGRPWRDRGMRGRGFEEQLGPDVAGPRGPRPGGPPPAAGGDLPWELDTDGGAAPEPTGPGNPPPTEPGTTC